MEGYGVEPVNDGGDGVQSDEPPLSPSVIAPPEFSREGGRGQGPITKRIHSTSERQTPRIKTTLLLQPLTNAPDQSEDGSQNGSWQCRGASRLYAERFPNK